MRRRLFCSSSSALALGLAAAGSLLPLSLVSVGSAHAQNLVVTNGTTRATTSGASYAAAGMPRLARRSTWPILAAP